MNAFHVTRFSAVVALVLSATAPALADPDHARVGQPAMASAAARTVQITMHDNYFEPESVSVKPGETVRFVVRNAGEFVHEFNLGTAHMHAEHQAEMAMMMEHGVLHADHIDHAAGEAMQKTMGHGAHNHPNSVLLEPGQTGEVVWSFPQGGELEFACNVPGHYETGMVGEVEIGAGS